MARSRSAGLALVIGTEYNDRDIKNLQRDLDRLKTKTRQAEGPFRKLGTSLKQNAGPALAAAGAAAGYMALQLGVDAVKAAAEEDKQMQNLAITLKNLGVAFDMPSLDAFIQSMQFASGVSDTELRTSLTTLVRSTKDVADAQDLLKLALDVSAGSGKSLSTVTSALSKAQSGNFSALKRLIPTIDATAIAQKNMGGVVQSLSTQFSGAAATAAQTYSGQMQILAQVAGEVQEAFGTGFLQGFFNTTDVAQTTSIEMQQLQESMQTLGTTAGQLGGIIAELGQIFSATGGQVLKFADNADIAASKGDILGSILGNLSTALLDFGTRGVYTALQNLGVTIDYFEGQDAAATGAATALDRYSYSWRNAASQINDNPIALDYDPYGQALGIQPTRFKTTIDTIIQTANDAQAAADQSTNDAAAAAAEAARKLVERTKKQTDRIVADLQDRLQTAREASQNFADIRRGYVQAAKADAAITTFAPEGPITGRGIAANIRQRVALVKRFADSVKKLQGQLNGAALADVIAQGPIAGLPYAQALLKDAGARRAVNRLQGQLAAPSRTIGRIGAELATGTTAAQLAAAETFTNKYVIGKDAIQITVNGDVDAKNVRQIRQAVRQALSDVGREGKNGKKVNLR